MTTNVLNKILLVIVTIFFFNLSVFSQNSINTLLNCPSNSDSLMINFAKFINVSGETLFKLQIICPDSTTSHNNLAVDSVKIKVEINSAEIEPFVKLKLDESITNYFKIVNIEINNAIDIEVAVIDEGFIKNNPSNLSNDGISGEVVKLSIIVYEQNYNYDQDALQLFH